MTEDGNKTAATCADCGREVSADEIGLTRKLTGRGTKTYFCLACLAEKFRVTEDLLREKIEWFRSEGCTLFPPKR